MGAPVQDNRLEAWAFAEPAMTDRCTHRLADVIRALGALRPGDAARGRILALLGVAVEDAQQSAPPQMPPKPEPPKPTVPLVDHEASPPSPQTGKPLFSILTVYPRSDAQGPTWLFSAPPLEERRASSLSNEPIEPLFRTNWMPSLISSAVGVMRESASLDIETTVSAIARATPLDRLPASLCPTLAHGVQLLVDQSEGMELFAADQELMMEAVLTVVGKDKTDIRFFTGCPVWESDKDTIEEVYDPPPRGTAVLALTDLGIGRPRFAFTLTNTADWLAFADRLAAAACPLVIFTPYPPSRWPRELQRRIKIIQWDRSTTVAKVKSVVGPGLMLP
jgi:hypothetical protein